MTENKVNIRPQVSMLSVLKHLEYETWYALAEFVDNAIASYQENRAELKKLNPSYKLEVAIELNDQENKIIIRDNAAGINKHDYARAFRAAEIPPNTTGLSEFGMGMKSASCWFSDCWSVRTTALGEDEERTIRFDMSKIVEDKIDELSIELQPASKKDHYTVIELLHVHRMPRKKGIAKVKSHLTSIYRQFLRNGTLTLMVDNVQLNYVEPTILNAKFQEKPYVSVGEPILWKKEINFQVEEGMGVKGFVAIRETGSTAEAGFALLRRDRVIEGSFDNGFRPEFIFGSPNSYRFQRVFGELHLEGFSVTFTKKGIQWDENLNIFLQLLKDEISTNAFPLLQQAENYRTRATDSEYKAANKALDKTVDDISTKAANVIKAVEENLTTKSEEEIALVQIEKKLARQFKATVNKQEWLISMELSYDPSIKDLFEVGTHLIEKGSNKNNSIRMVGIRLSLTHPFMIQFAGADSSKIEPILRIIASFGLSEIIARNSGAKTQGEIRRNLNDIITKLSAD